MSINIADWPVLPNVLPYLKLLFKKEMTTDISDDVTDATPWSLSFAYKIRALSRLYDFCFVQVLRRQNEY